MFTFQTYAYGQETSWSDTNSFRELVAVVGATTWEVMNAKKALNIVWEPFETFETETGPPDKRRKVQTQAGLEDSKKHTSAMKKAAGKPGKVLRRDGDPEAAFKSAKKILERHYTAPFLAHNTTEPMNFFAHVTNDKAELVGPPSRQQTLETGPFEVAVNQNWSEGIATSIRTGMERSLALYSNLEHLLFLLCDQPFVSTRLIQELVDTHLHIGKKITACRYGDTVGVPAMFSNILFPELQQLTGDCGAGGLIRQYPNDVAVVPFEQGATDVDTQEDYRRLLGWGVE